MSCATPDRAASTSTPLVINADSSAKQAELVGGWYRHETAWFGSTVFASCKIPYIFAEAQKLFHSGYELQAKDKANLQRLNAFMAKQDQSNRIQNREVKQNGL